MNFVSLPFLTYKESQDKTNSCTLPNQLANYEGVFNHWNLDGETITVFKYVWRSITN